MNSNKPLKYVPATKGVTAIGPNNVRHEAGCYLT